MRSAALTVLLSLACASSAPTGNTVATADAEDLAPPDTAPARDSAPAPAEDAAGRDAAGDKAPVEVPDAPLDRASDVALEKDSALPADASVSADGGGTLRLTSTGFLMRNGDLIFPASSSYPMDQSPPFEWSGAPAATASYALTFVDESNGATKWVVWDIPASVMQLPANLSKTVHPSEVPAASQRGSLGRTGYSGPGVPGPPLHVYQFVVWALDVQKLPNTDGLSTVDLRTKLLPMHALARSAPLVAKGQEGGP